MFLDGFLGGRSREHPWSMVHPWSMAHPWCMVVHLQSMVQDEDATMLRLNGNFFVGGQWPLAMVHGRFMAHGPSSIHGPGRGCHDAQAKREDFLNVFG